MKQPKPPYERIAFLASDGAEAQAALSALTARYGECDPKSAQAIVALGGDGLMLQTLHHHMHDGIPIFGMNCGSVGFLMNDYREEGLMDRLANAEISRVHPLVMVATGRDGKVHRALAINEVSLFRETAQAAKLKIAIDGTIRLDELICDGVLAATPAGSTAYNLSAHGPIVPINAPLIALTPICPFRPRRWRGALLPDKARISITVLEPEKRPVSAVADHFETRLVATVEINKSPEVELYLMCDPDRSMDERVLNEQFRY